MTLEPSALIRRSFARVHEAVAFDFRAGGKRGDSRESRVGTYFSRPTFIKLSVPPMATVETVTPIEQAHCCEGRRADEEAGLQVLRSGAGNGGGDADHAADHEREGGVVWRGPAGRKKIAQVAMSVAILMPLIGLEELPRVR